jgi:hypothetical protein
MSDDDNIIEHFEIFACTKYDDPKTPFNNITSNHHQKLTLSIAIVVPNGTALHSVISIIQ